MKHFILTKHVFCQKVPVSVIQGRCAKLRQRKRFLRKPKSSHNMKNMDQFLFITTIYILVPLFTHYYPPNRGTRIEILYFIVNFDKFFFHFRFWTMNSKTCLHWQDYLWEIEFMFPQILVTTYKVSVTQLKINIKPVYTIYKLLMSTRR